MNDLPVPESLTQLPSFELKETLPMPKMLEHPSDEVGETPVPLPLEQLMAITQMEMDTDTVQKLPHPQPIDSLLNK